MNKVYLIIYLILAVVILTVLIMILKEMLKAVPKLNKINDTAMHMQDNLNEINEKTAYINSVNNKIFTPKNKKIFAGLWIFGSILSDRKNFNKKTVKYAVKDFMNK